MVRYFNEKIRVTDRSTNTSYQNYDVDGEHGLSSDKYVEYLLDDSSRGDKFWCIGLFLIEIDESKLAFELHDNHEYQVWLNGWFFTFETQVIIHERSSRFRLVHGWMPMTFFTVDEKQV